LSSREYEPDRTRFPLRGIDVSHHQGAIDWTEVVSDDVAFAYVKASEGGDYRDRELRRNIAEANRVGLPVGAYHFVTFSRAGADQARNFVEAVPADATQLPPVLDLELDGAGDLRPSSQELGKEVEAFLDTAESRLGRMLVYYASDDFLEAYGKVLRPRPLWCRSMLQEPGNPGWTIWQYNCAGRVAGIAGDVDLNVLSIGLDELMALNRARNPQAGQPPRR
jgi:lysozyme